MITGIFFFRDKTVNGEQVGEEDLYGGNRVVEDGRSQHVVYSRAGLRLSNWIYKREVRNGYQHLGYLFRS